jgi:hypothetical protein
MKALKYMALTNGHTSLKGQPLDVMLSLWKQAKELCSKANSSTQDPHIDVSVPVEFSRVANLERLSQTGETYCIKANKNECDALCRRFEFQSIDELNATFTVRWLGGSSINFCVDGHLNAHIIQTCRVTDKPVPEKLDTSFSFRVLHTSQEQVMEDDPHDIEFTRSPDVDLGEIAAQYVSLSAAPYPRAADL